MVHIVIKPERDRDLYVVWSTVVDSPIVWGSRAEVLTWLADEHTRRFPGVGHNNLSDPAQRLARADARGTSATGGFGFFGRWDDDGFCYEQRGFLSRHQLARACELLDAGREPEVWDLLEPFEDHMEVRRGTVSA